MKYEDASWPTSSGKGAGEWYVKKPIPVRAQKMNRPFAVDTLEGRMKGKAGDYLVTGIEGEQYPCAGHIFEKTYNKVDGPDAQVQP